MLSGERPPLEHALDRFRHVEPTYGATIKVAVERQSR
jgi:hypothetical protein